MITHQSKTKKVAWTYEILNQDQNKMQAYLLQTPELESLKPHK
jgi:hypothetical protein